MFIFLLISIVLSRQVYVSYTPGAAAYSKVIPGECTYTGKRNGISFIIEDDNGSSSIDRKSTRLNSSHVF